MWFASFFLCATRPKYRKKMHDTIGYTTVQSCARTDPQQERCATDKCIVPIPQSTPDSKLHEARKLNRIWAMPRRGLIAG